MKYESESTIQDDDLNDVSTEIYLAYARKVLGEPTDAKEIKDAGYGDKLRLVENLEEDEDDEEDIEESPRCMATTNAGDLCPNDAKLPPEKPLVCKNHRHRMDELESVSESELDFSRTYKRAHYMDVAAPSLLYFSIICGVDIG